MNVLHVVCIAAAIQLAVVLLSCCPVLWSVVVLYVFTGVPLLLALRSLLSFPLFLPFHVELRALSSLQILFRQRDRELA